MWEGSKQSFYNVLSCILHPVEESNLKVFSAYLVETHTISLHAGFQVHLQQHFSLCVMNLKCIYSHFLKW